MSFILDALKKSEAERQRQAGPALLEMRVVRPQRRFPSWLLVLGGLVILVNLLVVLWLLLRPAATVALAAPAAVASASPAAAAPAPAPAPVLPALTVAPAMQTAEPYRVAGAAADQDQNAADLAPAAGNQVGNARSGVQNYSEVSGELPPLRLDLHVYAAAPADRYAFINMHKVKEGDTTSEGMRVLEITRDGVVLSYRDTEFLLGRD